MAAKRTRLRGSDNKEAKRDGRTSDTATRRDSKLSSTRDTLHDDNGNPASPKAERNLYAEILHIILPIRSREDMEPAYVAYKTLLGPSRASAEELWHAADVINFIMYALIVGDYPESDRPSPSARRKEFAKRLADMADIARGGKAAKRERILTFAELLLRTRPCEPAVLLSIATNCAQQLTRIDSRFGVLRAEEVVEALMRARKGRWKARRLAQELAERAGLPKSSADAFGQARTHVAKRMGWGKPPSDI